MALLRIHKLFGYYTNEIDLSKRCNIIIGENGLGKSTILKIINNLMKGKYVELCQTYFERIDFEDENVCETIRMADLLPSPEQFTKHLHWEAQTMELVENDSNNVNDPNSIILQIHNRIKELIKNYGLSAYHKLAINVFFDKPLEPCAEQLLPSVESYNNDFGAGEWKFHDYIKKVLKKMYKEKVSYFGPKPTDKVIQTYFTGTKITEFAVINNLLENNNWYYIDMVENYYFGERQIISSNLVSRNISWLSRYNNVFESDKQTLSLEQYYQYGEINFKPSFIGLPPEIDVRISKPLVDFVKIIYEKPDYIRFDLGCSEFMKLFSGKHIVEINAILRDNYYDLEFVKQFNTTAISYYHNILGQELHYCQGEGFGFYNSHYDEIMAYFKPIVLRDSIFDMDFDDLIKDHQYDIYDCRVHQAFMKFHEDQFYKLKEVRSAKINKFEMLLNKYLFNKEIHIYPCGIKVYVKNDSNKVHNSGLRLLSSKTEEINLNSLSSGEKKLIILMFLAIFFENTILLIDEPELSLSIVWQSNLLPDLLKETSVKKILVSTHSPFIAEDESLRQYLFPLSIESGDTFK